MIPPTSRYANVGESSLEAPDGANVVYVRPRLLPDPDSLRGPDVVLARAGERADLLATRVLGSPAQFARLCDANAICDPFSLTSDPAPLYVPRLRPQGQP